jgi:hypothetical protein
LVAAFGIFRVTSFLKANAITERIVFYFIRDFLSVPDEYFDWEINSHGYVIYPPPSMKTKE